VLRPALTFVLSLALALQAVSPVAAQEEPEPDASRMRWNQDEWGRFGTHELALGSFVAIGGIGMQVFLIPEVGRASGGVLVDDVIRDALQLRRRPDRSTAARISDILVNVNLVWPYLVDTLVIAWAVDGSRDVAGQMFWINALAYAMTTATLSATKNLVARERPYHDECLNDLEYDGGCTNADRYRSFFSGHSAFAFTGASLMCIHHANLPLYDSRALDLAACLAPLAIATTVATLRIAADKHYFSDVLIGALVGVFSGLVIPAIFHYGWDWDRSEGTSPDPLP
jgi:membrane-associated phospholipid phosphatase